MKICVYETRNDEIEFLNKYARLNNCELILHSEVPSLDNADFVLGCDGVSTLGQARINDEILSKWKDNGIKYFSTRTIGFNHIDLDAAHKYGIRVCHAAYDPNGVADFTIMMMLMCMRHYKQAMWRGQVNDFALNGLRGKEMRNMTVGIIGTGKIGCQVVKNLKGFGCKIVAYDPYPKKDLQDVTYMSLDELYKVSDIITLHIPLTDENYHMIDAEAINKMKDGVILINCARGGLCDSEALIDGIENEKIGAIGMDTIEGEEGIIHNDRRTDIIKARDLFYLHQFRNVIMTQHMAFYTKEAVDSMARYGIEGIIEMSQNKKCNTEI
ncbi:MAG: D-isomer specific 2-hydroxyacid dehydrogenase family protein [Erysipelotrichaceae bacterium]|nr:D-isomer specific 2-hydroxyacid dehydrogenase family protein [Erysipelotrichaceae bacterium]